MLRQCLNPLQSSVYILLNIWDACPYFRTNQYYINTVYVAYLLITGRASIYSASLFSHNMWSNVGLWLVNIRSLFTICDILDGELIIDFIGTFFILNKSMINSKYINSLSNYRLPEPYNIQLVNVIIQTYYRLYLITSNVLYYSMQSECCVYNFLTVCKIYFFNKEIYRSI